MAPKKQGNYRVCGYDLPDRQCPECGSVMIADGADILSEVNMGLYLDREPDVILNFSPEIRNEIIEFIKQQFISDQVYRAGIKAELPDGSIKRNVHLGGIYIIPRNEDISDLTLLREPESDDKLQLKITEEDYHKLDGKLKKYDVLSLPELGLLHDLESETGIDQRGIRFNDDEILRVFLDVDNSFMRRFSNLYKVIIQGVKPKCFSDLARIDGLAHGAGIWSGNGSELVKAGKTVREIISCRDDVMQYLMSMGVSKDISYKTMNNVRSGKGLTGVQTEKMISAGSPEWYIESCNKIQYVYPWAHCVEYTLMNWRLAYYWSKYPDLYNTFYEKRFNMQ